MAVREKNVSYMPNDPSLINMEQDPELIILKKYAICDIVTGKPYVYSHETSGIALYGTLLLEEIGLNLGDYPVETLPDLGIVSLPLTEEIKNFSSYVLLDSVKRYLLSSANDQVKEKISRLMYELMNSEHSSYTPAEYLGAVANIYFLMSKHKDDESILQMVERDTPFRNREGNKVAIKSAKRFTYKQL